MNSLKDNWFRTLILAIAVLLAGLAVVGVSSCRSSYPALATSGMVWGAIAPADYVNPNAGTGGE